jgi:hypothetical protein
LDGNIKRGNLPCWNYIPRGTGIFCFKGIVEREKSIRRNLIACRMYVDIEYSWGFVLRMEVLYILPIPCPVKQQHFKKFLHHDGETGTIQCHIEIGTTQSHIVSFAL